MVERKEACLSGGWLPRFWGIGPNRPCLRHKTKVRAMDSTDYFHFQSEWYGSLGRLPQSVVNVSVGRQNLALPSDTVRTLEAGNGIARCATCKLYMVIVHKCQCYKQQRSIASTSHYCYECS